MNVVESVVPGSCSRFVPGLLFAAASLSCTSGKLIILGDEWPVPYHFGVPAPVSELASTFRTDNPTLTGDELEIYFTANKMDDNDGDVWFAERATTDSPFGAPEPVAEVNTTSFETSSAISTDGLTLWFGSDRTGGLGGLDIWMSARTTRQSAWSTPVNVVALNSTANDIPRPPGFHASVMPLASSQVTPANPGLSNYQTYFASRATRDAPFRAPVPVPELAHADRSTVDGFLTDDGLTFFFSSTLALAPAPDGGAATDAGQDASAAAPTADLFVTWRRSIHGPFSEPQPLTDLNTPGGDERDPWMSPDGTTFYFTSDRGGALNIYRVNVKPR